MLKMEKRIPAASFFSLGYNRCEALITLARTPDNTFPIFWKKYKIGKQSFDAPFSREDTIELLLNVIQNSGSVGRLLRENLSYKDVSELISKLVDDGLLEYVDRKLELTDEGKEILENGKDIIREANKDLWISPENISRVKKFDKSFIFLPNNTELDF